MTHWRYEDGIGEERAALVDDDGVILEARVEPDTPRLRLGLVADARAVRLEAGRYAIVEIDGHEAIVDPRPRPRAWTQGQRVRVEVVREALAEPGLVKRARVRPVPAAEPRAAPTLLEEIAASGVAVAPHSGQVFDEDGDRDVVGEAAGSPVRFDGGQLHVELTRAMTLIDVDGWADPDTLAVRAAPVAALAVRRLGIGGSIGIDFPTGGRDARLAAAEAFDAALPKPFERTAVNGFGFMQVVRPRRRPSLLELHRYDAVGCAARFAIRQAQRSGRIGAARIVGAAAVVEAIEHRPNWTARLARELGGPVTLRADPAMPIWTSYVEHP